MAHKPLNQAQHLVVSAMLQADHWDGPITTEKAVWTMSIKQSIGEALPPRVYAGTLGGLVNAGVLVFGGKGTIKDPSSVALTEAGFETLTAYGMIDEKNYPTGAEWKDLTPPKKRGGRPAKVAAEAAPATVQASESLPAPSLPDLPADPAPAASEEDSGEAKTSAEAFEDKFFGKDEAQKARKAARAKERRAAAKAAKQAEA